MAQTFLSTPARPQTQRQNNWCLDQVIGPNHRIAPVYFQNALPLLTENFTRLLARDVFSEADAQFLYDWLLERGVSPTFRAMLERWLADELKHYQALRRCYHALAGVSYEEMDREAVRRAKQRDIEPIEDLLVDEFSILLLLAYDEIGSTYSYRRDLHEFYRHFGRAIAKVGQHLVRDEGQHFSNAAELILSLYPDRLKDVSATLTKFDIREKQLACTGSYHGTFFLDHAQEQARFPKDFNAITMQVIEARLGIASLPSQDKLKRLWQWKPEGYAFVPV